jgi:hypothetical protein
MMSNSHSTANNKRQCNCIYSLKLKIEQEMDRLRGEFRKKELSILQPLLNKFSRLEMQFMEFSETITGRQNESESRMKI